jgi:hypothetical protein
MTAIRGLKQVDREIGITPTISWTKYLNHIVEADPDLHAVCLRLDEEGNQYCELTPEEAEMLAGKLMQVAKTLRERKKRELEE